MHPAAARIVPPFREARVFFGYFSGCGCLGSILVSVVLSLLLSMCFNVF